MSHSNLSFWEKNYYFQSIDMLIIGAGIVGLNAGIECLEQNPEMHIVILERGSIPNGASTKNAGFACFGSPSELLFDLKSHNTTEVFGLFNRRYMGIQKLLEKVNSNAMDFKATGGYEIVHPRYSELIPSEDDLSRLNKQIEEYTGLKNCFSFQNEKIATFGFQGISGLIATPYEGILNPVKMIHELIERFLTLGGKIFWGMEIKTIEEIEEEVIVRIVDGLKIQSKNCLVCVNGFAKKLFPELDVQASRNQVIVIKSEKKIPFEACFHMNCGYTYMRSVDGFLLIGGARNLDIENEKTDQQGQNDLIIDFLHEMLSSHFIPNQSYSVISQWSGIMGLGQKKQPIIQKRSKRIGLAVRMGGMGIAIGSLVGSEAAQMMLNKN